MLDCDFGDIMEYVPESDVSSDLFIGLNFDAQSKINLSKNQGEKNDRRLFAIS